MKSLAKSLALIFLLASVIATGACGDDDRPPQEVVRESVQETEEYHELLIEDVENNFPGADEIRVFTEYHQPSTYQFRFNDKICTGILTASSAPSRMATEPYCRNL